MKPTTTSISELSSQEKRAVLVKLLQEDASGYARLLDALATPIRNLQAEAVLDAAIRSDALSSAPTGEPAHIFLTGATGFLGAFLLHGLLQQTPATIYCLVRAPDTEAAKKRLQQTLETYAIQSGELNPRIIPIVGDLSQPLLGLPASEFQTLARTIDTIYHNGASVNWIYPYDSLKAANVLGTQEVLRLACQHTVKPVHYVSSLAVFPILFNAKVKVFREQDTLDQHGVLYGGYTQSKWVAEKIVTIARSRGIPICIYRPGLITGHSQTGVWNTDDVACRMLKSLIELGSTPDVYHTVEMTPVDYVSQAIVHLSRQPASLGKVFHVINPHSLHWSDLFAWLRSFGYPLQSIPYAKWRARLLTFGLLGGNAAYTLLPLFTLQLSERAPSMMQNFPAFDCQNTLDKLAGTSIVCPPVDRHVFEAYIAHFIRCGFLAAPPPGGTLPGVAHPTGGAYTTPTT